MFRLKRLAVNFLNCRNAKRSIFYKIFRRIFYIIAIRPADG